jgi:drug/metabolite transporter (DMT)-like permease
MTWLGLALASGLFNGLWTSGIKSKVQKSDALSFTSALRWGVGLLLLPAALLTWRSVPPAWWLLTAVSGILECVSLWTMARGARHDYYATYALSNTTPAFMAVLAPFLLGESMTTGLWSGTILVSAGALWMHYRGHWSWWGMATALLGAGAGVATKSVIGQGSAIAHASLSFLMGALFLHLLRRGNRAMRASHILTRAVEVRWLILLSALATLCYFTAVSLAPLTRVSPFVRVNLLVGFVLSHWVLKERRDWQGRAVGAFILLSGLLVILWRP